MVRRVQGNGQMMAAAKLLQMIKGSGKGGTQRKAGGTIKPSKGATNGGMRAKAGATVKSVKGGGKGGMRGNAGGAWKFVPSIASLKGSGKGKLGKASATNSKFMDKLAKIDASRKVWVGGLSNKTTWKTLEKHFSESLGNKPSVTELMPKGRACLAFKTDGDASAAIASLNATELDGKTIEVDVWTQKEKIAKPDKAERQQKSKKKVIKTAFAKKVMRGDPKMKEKLDKVDNELKVWVGGMAKETKHGDLRKHFNDAGCKPHMVNLTGKDRACVSFKTADEAQAAISTLAATELGGSTLEVDVWQKVEKKEKTA